MDLDALIRALQNVQAQYGNLPVFREEGFFAVREILQVVVQDTDKSQMVILSSRNT